MRRQQRLSEGESPGLGLLLPLVNYSLGTAKICGMIYGYGCGYNGNVERLNA